MSDIEFRSDLRVTYVDSMGDDRRIAQAARVSTAGLDNDREKYVGLVRALIRDGHWSPLESCTMTIAFDVPAFTRDQIIRHRSMSFSVFSLRYSEAKPVFWVPSDDRPLVQVGKALDYRREQGSKVQRILTEGKIVDAATRAWLDYERMIESGVANEVARTVLPNSVYSPFWATGNLRSWLHFVGIRNDPHAQHEVREAAEKVEAVIASKFPVALEAFRARQTKEETIE